MIEVVVDRTKWLRGEGHHESALLRERDGKQCCVGFLARVLGAATEDILGRRILSAVSGKVGPCTDFEKMHYYELDEAYSANDDGAINDSQREIILQDIGHSMDVNFTFVN